MAPSSPTDATSEPLQESETDEIRFARMLKGQVRTSRKEDSTHSRTAGFTLMELLIVISIIVILMLIAIPNSSTIKKQANELSAQQSLQTIEQGESMYETTYPVNGFACTLHPGGSDRLWPAQPAVRASSAGRAGHRQKTATSSPSTTAPRSR